MPPRRGARRLRPVKLIRRTAPEIPRAVRPLAVTGVVLASILLFLAVRTCVPSRSDVVLVDAGGRPAAPSPPAVRAAPAARTVTVPAPPIPPAPEPAPTPEPVAAEPAPPPPVTISPGAVDAAFHAVQDDVMSCYRRFYGSTGPTGSVRLRAEVGESGDVLSCDVSSDSLTAAAFSTCVRTAAARARFPALAKDQRITVEYTYSFRQR